MSELKNKLVLIVGRGYFAQAFTTHLAKLENPPTVLTLGRGSDIAAEIRHKKPALVINAAGYAGEKSFDDCETNRGKTMESNVLLPVAIRDACFHASVPWAHLSSSAVFNGKRNRPKKNDEGWREEDKPNFNFGGDEEEGDSPYGFYAGSKHMAERLIGRTRCWICRIGLPFSPTPHPRNHITRLLSYPILMHAENSISSLEESVKLIVNLYLYDCPHGIYHITNPGSLTTFEAAELIGKHLPERAPKRPTFQFCDPVDLNQPIVREPGSSVVLSTEKIKNFGLAMGTASKAFIEAVSRYGSISHSDEPETLNGNDTGSQVAPGGG